MYKVKMLTASALYVQGQTNAPKLKED